MSAFKYLIKWFEEEKRELPWRENPTPYHVWVSEVMLQQTQVAVVKPYYRRWMEKYPTLEALAQAKEEEVIKLWEGLGYYSRARNLLAGAQFVVENFEGAIPDIPEDLAKIKGIGPYTQGAILSFAFHQKKAAVDGNVLRVMARFLALDEDIGKEKTKKLIAEKTEALLPDKEPHLAMEALIELGATLCSKHQPSCSHCPLRGKCQAFAQGKTTHFPIKKQKVTYTSLFRFVPIYLYAGECLIRKVAQGEIMSGLYEFPYEEIEGEVAPFLKNKGGKALAPIKQTFTRYRVTLYPSIFELEERKILSEFEWVPLVELKKFPFSSGHRKILSKIISEAAYEHSTHRGI